MCVYAVPTLFPHMYNVAVYLPVTFTETGKGLGTMLCVCEWEGELFSSSFHYTPTTMHEWTYVAK